MILDKLQKYNTILKKLKKDIDITSMRIDDIISWTEQHEEFVNKEKLIAEITKTNNTITELIDSAKEIFNETISELNEYAQQLMVSHSPNPRRFSECRNWVVSDY